MKTTLPLVLSAALALIVAGCSKTDSTEVAETVTDTAMSTETTNPFSPKVPCIFTTRNSTNSKTLTSFPRLNAE